MLYFVGAWGAGLGAWPGCRCREEQAREEGNKRQGVIREKLLSRVEGEVRNWR